MSGTGLLPGCTLNDQQITVRAVSCMEAVNIQDVCIFYFFSHTRIRIS